MVRHIKKKHKNESEVLNALKLPAKKRASAFDCMRKEGIYKYNKSQMKEDIPTYNSERVKTKENMMILCCNCSGFYSRSYISRHKQVCCRSKSPVLQNRQKLQTMPLTLISEQLDNVKTVFKEDILSKFMNDAVGSICVSDPSIILYGSRMFNKSIAKPDKKAEVKKSVMTDMRRLGGLYKIFSERMREEGITLVDSRDMLTRKYFDHLLLSIDEFTIGENDTIKAGLKIGLYYLIKKFAKIVKGSYLLCDNDVGANEIDKFSEILELHETTILGSARYILNRNRQTNLRRPENLPVEADVKLVQEYTVNKICQVVKELPKDCNYHLFAKLRDLLVSRLTLFNARRGGEPARMTIQEWKDAENNSWINMQRLNTANYSDQERDLIKNMKITF